MAIRVEPYKGERSPHSVTMTRRRGGGGEMDELEELFEQLMEGGDLEDVEGLEEFDWEGLWESFMEGEGAYEGEGGVPQQASDRPTMFGSPIRPGGFRRPGSLNDPGYGMFY